MHTQQNGGKHMIAEVLLSEIEPWQKSTMSLQITLDAKHSNAQPAA